MICVCKRDDPAHESQPDGTRVEVRGVAGVWQSGAVQPERFRQSLFVGFVGERDQDQLEHAITKLCDSSEQVTNRRQTMNNYFMAINSAIIGGMAWRALAALDQYGRAADQATSSHWSIVAVSVGIVFVSLGATYLCQVWWCILAQYKKVSRSKIELHEALESKRRGGARKGLPRGNQWDY